MADEIKFGTTLEQEGNVMEGLKTYEYLGAKPQVLDFILI